CRRRRRLRAGRGGDEQSGDRDDGEITHDYAPPRPAGAAPRPPPPPRPPADGLSSSTNVVAVQVAVMVLLASAFSRPFTSRPVMVTRGVNLPTGWKKVARL